MFGFWSLKEFFSRNYDCIKSKAENVLPFLRIELYIQQAQSGVA